MKEKSVLNTHNITNRQDVKQVAGICAKTTKSSSFHDVKKTDFILYWSNALFYSRKFTSVRIIYSLLFCSSNGDAESARHEKCEKGKRDTILRGMKIRDMKMRENEYVGLTYCKRLMQEIMFKTIKSI